MLEVCGPGGVVVFPLDPGSPTGLSSQSALCIQRLRATSPMNTRFQHLAEQAKTGIPPATLGVTEWIRAYNQRFGELVVRECAEICQEATDHTNILKHFGLTPHDTSS